MNTKNGKKIIMKVIHNPRDFSFGCAMSQCPSVTCQRLETPLPGGLETTPRCFWIFDVSILIWRLIFLSVSGSLCIFPFAMMNTLKYQLKKFSNLFTVS